MAGLVKERTNTKAKDKEILKKAKETKSPVKKIRGLKSLPDKIETARQAVEKYLGDKRDQFKCVTTLDELKQYAESAKQNGIVALDTETTSLDTFTCEIVGFSLYTKASAPLAQLPPCYVPINHINYVDGTRLPNQLNIDEVKDIFQDIVDNDVKVLFFNADFDIRVILHTIGVRLHPYFDCYIGARLLNENEPDNGLKALHSKYVLHGQEEEFSFGELFEKIPFNMIPIDIAYLYASKDALVTFELYEFQLPYLTVGTEENTEMDLAGVANVFWNIEMPVLPIVIDMEELGIGIDFKYQQKLSTEYNEELQRVEKEFYELLKKYTDNEYSISSSKQLSTLFYDELKLLKPAWDKKAKKWKTSVDADTLSTLNHPLAEKILEYRLCQKLISTYVDKMAILAERDGKVHGGFNQVGTDTGRFSSKNPNLQNIPSHNTKIRKMFIPSDGCVFVGGDFSAQEVRVVADMCGDEGMIQAYRDGKDLYCEIASMSFHVPYEQCLEFNPDGTTNKEGKERRSIAKKIVLSINYGKGINSLAEDLGKSIDEAKAIYSAVMDAYPKLKQFIADSKHMASTVGYVTTKFGRKRRLPDCLLPHYEFKFTDGGFLTEKSEQMLTRKLDNMWFKDREKYIQDMLTQSHIIVKDNSGFIARAERQCVNARVQGTSADMVKIVMRTIAEDEIMKKCKFKLCLQVHDEVIGECPREHAKEAKERLKYLMEHCMDGYMQVPLKTDISVTDRWYGEEINV